MKDPKLINTISVMAILLSGLFVCDHSASALTYQSNAEVGFTFNPTISLNLSGDLVISNLAPGTASDSNIIDVTVATNASQGYNLLITVGVKGGTSSLVNSSNNNYTFTNLSTTPGTVSSLANFTDDTWGYSYSVDNGTNWISGSTGSTASGYAGLPLDNNDNAEERGNGGIALISTTNPADNRTIKFKIGAKASQSQASGTYTNTVNFYAVANPDPELGPVACPAGKICYNNNSLTTVQGEMRQQSASNGASTTLWASNFKKDGYGFAGWSDTYDGSGQKFGPNQTITAPSNISTNGLSLYAIWVKSAGDMQNWEGCESLPRGEVTALKDSRDNNVYAVAKLADYKCWMIENLRLDNIPELSDSNTNNPSLPLTNIYDSSTTSNHLSPTSSLAYDATTAPEGWCSTDSSACYDQSRLRTDNITLFTDNTSSSYSISSNVYSYGNYYNWYSATAGHGKYDSRSGYTAPGDICPTGWQLPTGNTSGEFDSLNTALSGTDTGITASNNLRSYPNNFVFSGYVTSSSVYERSSNGGYWSSSAYNGSSSSAYYLYLNSSNVGPGTYGYSKYLGRMVRCVTSPPA
ncbi:hypothetical protein IJG12_00750 [Candidatus Saccharibacteria bacterium]|nr:hypothetical protein [Candidatus Saccharibacteria bacterium]